MGRLRGCGCRFLILLYVLSLSLSGPYEWIYVSTAFDDPTIQQGSNVLIKYQPPNPYPGTCDNSRITACEWCDNEISPTAFFFAGSGCGTGIWKLNASLSGPNATYGTYTDWKWTLFENSTDQRGYCAGKWDPEVVGSDAYPGNRNSPVFHSTSDGYLVVFSGMGRPVGTVITRNMADLWIWNSETEWWSFVYTGAPGPGPDEGDFHSEKTTIPYFPGGRYDALSWFDLSSDEMYVFGGNQVGHDQCLWKIGLSTSNDNAFNWSFVEVPTSIFLSYYRRSECAVAVIRNLAYVFCVVYPNVRAQIVVYDMETGEWSSSYDYPQDEIGASPRFYDANASLVNPGARGDVQFVSDRDRYIYLYGGYLSESGYVADFWRYDVTARLWTWTDTPVRYEGYEWQSPKCHDPFQNAYEIVPPVYDAGGESTLRIRTPGSRGRANAFLVADYFVLYGGFFGCNRPYTLKYYGDLWMIPLKCQGNDPFEVCNGKGICNDGSRNDGVCECQDAWTSENCSSFDCFGIPSDNLTVCRGHGNCVTIGVCQCETGNYTGQQCEYPICFGQDSISDNVCSHFGECFAPDTCICDDGHTGNECEFLVCYSKTTENPSASGTCSHPNGTCDAPDNCTCLLGYFGDECEFLVCYSKTTEDQFGSGTCSNPNGTCIGPDDCLCDVGYSGHECEFTECFGKTTENPVGSATCSSPNGTCVAPEQCLCHDGYSGSECEFTVCYGKSTENRPCSFPFGVCVAPDQCACISGHAGSECEHHFCYGKLDYEQHVCSGHGACQSVDTCACHLGYGSDDCSMYTCFGETDPSACHDSHGTCNSSDYCSCELNSWTGSSCEFPICFGKASTDKNVCSGEGVCAAPNLCQCFDVDRFTGEDCEHPVCFGVPIDGGTPQCLDKGICVAPNECQCYTGYIGLMCNDGFTCSSLCSGHGDCVGPELCSCQKKFDGPICNLTDPSKITMDAIIVAAVITPICCVLLVVLVIFLVVVMAFRRKKSSKSSTESYIPLLESTSLHNLGSSPEDASLLEHLSTFRVDPSLSTIDVAEVVLERVVGHGGSGCIVYYGTWKSVTPIAAKVFRLTFSTSQEDFDEMTREATVMAKLAHPNVLRVWGFGVILPQIAIILEWCQNGDIAQFIRRHRSEKERHTSMVDKLRWLCEICSGMEYLHSQSIIRSSRVFVLCLSQIWNRIDRDLKCENVLLDSSKSAKIMDFGLSLIASNDDVSKTKGIGTAIYMAPEMTLGKDYTELVDVFAFSILAWCLMTESFRPYGKAPLSEMKVAHDSNFRPSLNCVPSRGWIRDLLVQCWAEDCEIRPSFTELRTLFTDGRRKMDDETLTLLAKRREETEYQPIDISTREGISGLVERLRERQILSESSNQSGFSICTSIGPQVVQLLDDDDLALLDENAIIIIAVDEGSSRKKNKKKTRRTVKNRRERSRRTRSAKERLVRPLLDDE